MQNLILHIEAIIFSSASAVSIKELMTSFKNSTEENLEQSELENCISELIKKYSDEKYSFELKKVGGGYQFLTKPVYHDSISLFLNQKAKRKLSTSALETLSIIAYKQPVTKSEIEQIRGVNSDYSVHKLLEKELINIAGKADRPGKPILYVVSQYFLDYFGINSIEEMPKLKEIMPQQENEIGVSEE